MTPAPKKGIVSVFVKQKLGLSGEGRGEIFVDAKASSVLHVISVAGRRDDRDRRTLFSLFVGWHGAQLAVPYAYGPADDALVQLPGLDLVVIVLDAAEDTHVSASLTSFASV